MADLSNFTIRLASDTQRQQHLRGMFVPWGGGRDWEGFLEALRQSKWGGDWTQNGAYRCWVLVRKDDMDGPVYSGCETFRRNNFVKAAGSDQVSDAIVYGVTAVVTPVQHHRCGFATHLLRLLHYQLASPTFLPPFPASEWGSPPSPLSADDRAQIPPAIASVLCSDVGSTFYERVTIGLTRPGWIVKDEENQEISWKLHQRSPSSDTLPVEVRKSTWLYTRDLPAISQELSLALHQGMLDDHAQAKTTVWAPDPASPGILTYLPSRFMRPRSTDWRTTYDTEPCGIRLPSLVSGEPDAIVLFANRQVKDGFELAILHIHGLAVEQLPELLEALDEAGALAGSAKASMWGVAPDSAIGKALMGQNGREGRGGKRGEVNGCLLGVAWYGNPEDRGHLLDTQMWSTC